MTEAEMNAAFEAATMPIPDLIAKLTPDTPPAEVDGLLSRIHLEVESDSAADGHYDEVARRVGKRKGPMKADRKAARKRKAAPTGDAKPKRFDAGLFDPEFEKKHDAALARFVDGGEKPTKETVEIVSKWLPGCSATAVPVYNKLPKLDELPWPISHDMLPYALAAIDAQCSVVNMDGHMRYLRVRPKGGIDLFERAAFIAKYEKFTVQPPRGARKSIGEEWLRHAERHDLDGVTYSPGVTDVGDMLNLWRGYAVEPKKGDWSLMKAHMFTVLCSGNREWFHYLMSQLAQMFQDPLTKTGVAIVLRGQKGSGKTTLAQYLASILGDRDVVEAARMEQVSGRFNGHLANCFLLVAAEAMWAGDKAGDAVMKQLISDPQLQIEAKGKDSVRMRNCTRVMFITNERWVVPATKDERRYFGLDVSSDRIEDVAYFNALYAERDNGGAAAFLYDLLHYDYRGVNLRKPPLTPMLRDQIERSLDPFDKWWWCCLEDGGITDPSKDGDFYPFHAPIPKHIVYEAARRGVAGFYKGKVSDDAVSDFLKDIVPGLGMGKGSAGARRPTFIFTAQESMEQAFERKNGVGRFETTDTLEGLPLDLIDMEVATATVQ